MQGTQIDNSPIENFPKITIFSMPSLIEEKKPVLLVKYESEKREKLKMKCFFFESFGLSGQ